MAYRNKGKYKSYPNKFKNTNKLEPGMSGFLCTCNGKFREKDCVRESYVILNDYADDLFGSQDVMPDKKLKPSGTSEEADVETLLAAEVRAIKEEGQKKESKRFQVVESGANGIVFIKTTVPDPVKLAHTIVSNYAKGVQRSKFLLRLLPVEITCKAYIEEITLAVEPLLEKYFSGDGKTFAVVFNHRNNDSLKRDELIEKLADLVCQKNILHKADLKQPQLVILLEVIRSICCISVVPDYYTLKKYNVMENALKSSEKNDTIENNPEHSEHSEKEVEVEPSEKNQEVSCNDESSVIEK